MPKGDFIAWVDPGSDGDESEASLNAETFSEELEQPLDGSPVDEECDESISTASPPTSPGRNHRTSTQEERLWKGLQASVPLSSSIREESTVEDADAIILMSTPETSLDGAPVMENLLYVAKHATNVVAAFDRKGEGVSSFEKDKGLFEKGDILDTQWAASYIGRVAGSATQIYNNRKENGKTLVLKFVSVDGGCVSQWEQRVLTSPGFRERLEKDIKKIIPDANLAIETLVLSYEALCKDLDRKNALGLGMPMLASLRNHWFEAVIPEAKGLHVTLHLMEEAFKDMMKRREYMNAMYVKQKIEHYETLMGRVCDRYKLERHCNCSSADAGYTNLTALHELAEEIAELRARCCDRHAPKEPLKVVGI